MKILALDIGDRWVGSALSDSSRVHSFPLKTISRSELAVFLKTTLKLDRFDTVVYGLPLTLRGSEGLQSKKILDCVEKLKLDQGLQGLLWVCVDERFSSRSAMHILHEQNRKIKDSKMQEHSIVAAVLLESYLLSFR